MRDNLKNPWLLMANVSLVIKTLIRQMMKSYSMMISLRKKTKRKTRRRSPNMNSLSLSQTPILKFVFQWSTSLNSKWKKTFPRARWLTLSEKWKMNWKSDTFRPNISGLRNSTIEKSEKWKSESEIKCMAMPELACKLSIKKSYKNISLCLHNLNFSSRWKLNKKRKLRC